MAMARPPTAGQTNGPIPHTNGSSNGVVTGTNGPAPMKVNTKKAKRRAKEAAKKQAQAEAQADAQGGQNLDYSPSYPEQERYDDDYDSYDDYQYEGQAQAGASSGAPATNGTHGKKGKKKKPKHDAYPNLQNDYKPNGFSVPPPPPPRGSMVGRHSGHGDRIWNTSTQEERERIKQFWLGLKEDDRRQLVKIEKEAVLKKMKEQQKHSCSCTVCGRKRTAIEEELEVLYDAYYDELEQLPPDRMPAIMEPDFHRPPRGPIVELSEDEELDDDDYSEAEYDDEDEDDDEEDDGEDYGDDQDDALHPASADFFNFGNSLTVKGGILTVADDLLKNDGKKFIEMMEQLAERRMQREEEAQYAAASHPNNSYYDRGHGHAEEEEYDEEDDEEYDSEEDYGDEEEDMETMTEDQRMQEGRRMFQIFAARMFEQRVLSAYREKVAKERQDALLQEEEESKGQEAKKEEKRQREAEKRRIKRQAQKQKQLEDKMRKDAEKAAQEEALKAEQEKKQEELRRRREEQRVKKEELRKAQEAEASRKAAEKAKRLKEEQDRRQEAERKRVEQKEMERKAKEEAKKAERVKRETDEREAKERKARAEQERREKDLKERAEQERLRKENQAVHAAQQAAQAAKRAAAPAAVPILSRGASNIASPIVPAAVPKAPTPNRPRQNSQHGTSKHSSPQTPAAPAGRPKSGSPGAVGGHVQGQQPPIAPKTILSRPPSQAPVPLAPQSALASVPSGIAPPPGMPNSQPSPFGMPLGPNGFPHGPSIMPHGNHPRPSMPPGFIPQQQPFGGPFGRQFPPPNGIPPPGMGAPGSGYFGRGSPDSLPAPPGLGNFMSGAPNYPTSMFPDTMPGRTVVPGQHSRQQSGSSTAPDHMPIGTTTALPIRPPAPIQRPSSVKPGNSGDLDLENMHLGSSALLDDDEAPENDYTDRRPSMPVGPSPGAGDFPSFASPGSFSRSFMPPPASTFSQSPWLSSGPSVNSPLLNNTWSNSPASNLGMNTWGQAPGFGGPFNHPNNPSLHPISAPGRSRIAQARIHIIDSYKNHVATGKATDDGWVNLRTVFLQTSSSVQPPLQSTEFANLLDTESTGVQNNGGGSFTTRGSPDAPLLDKQVKWTADEDAPTGKGFGTPGGGGVGEIGSPVVGAATPFGSLRGSGFGGFGGGQQQMGGQSGPPPGLMGLGQQQ